MKYIPLLPFQKLFYKLNVLSSQRILLLECIICLTDTKKFQNYSSSHFLGMRTEHLLFKSKTERSFDSWKDQISHKTPVTLKRRKVYFLHHFNASSVLPSSLKFEHQLFLKFPLLIQQLLQVSDNFRLFAG